MPPSAFHPHDMPIFTKVGKVERTWEGAWDAPQGGIGADNKWGRLEVLNNLLCSPSQVFSSEEEEGKWCRGKREMCVGGNGGTTVEKVL